MGLLQTMPPVAAFRDAAMRLASRLAPGPALALASALVLGAGGGLTPLLGARAAFAKGPDSLADLAAEISDTVVNISATQTIDAKARRQRAAT